MQGEGPQRSIRIDVCDTGPGLAAADLDRIFEEFEQADGTSTRRHDGAGLGLAISRRIVEAMGGTLTVESAVGKGSTFSIAIPAIGEVSQQPQEQLLAGKGVVIVSVNEVEASAIAMTVAAHGGRAACVRTPAEAAHRLAEGTYSAVLVDAALETAEGGVLARIRAKAPRDFTALTLIAPTDRGRLAEFRASGYASFLARPVRGATLTRLLASGDGVAASPQAGAAQVAFARSAVTGARLRVLLAEDNDINALLARAALTRAGHEVDVVGNGKAAVDALDGPDGGHRYVVVLMDLHMPVLDGLDAIALIRKSEEERGLPPVPILVLTADGQEKTRHEVLAHGASGFVTKPVDPARLVEAIEGQRTAA
jgi:CheY-like chemotaxis protein